MQTVSQDLGKRLLFILHRGFVEIRNLAGSPENCQQISELADALELLPRFVTQCNQEELEVVRFVLKNYETKYPRRFYDYSKYLDQETPPDRY